MAGGLEAEKSRVRRPSWGTESYGGDREREMVAAIAGGAAERWCMVTSAGGRGFATRHLVTMVLRSGEWRVRAADLAPAIAFDRGDYMVRSGTSAGFHRGSIIAVINRYNGGAEPLLALGQLGEVVASRKDGRGHRLASCSRNSQ